MTSEYEECLALVQRESPGTDFEKQKRLAKELVERVHKYNEPRERAWLHWDELPL